MLCAYGCNQEARFMLRNGKVPSCSKSHNGCPAIKEKKKAIYRERYGTDSPFQNEDVKERIKASNLRKYGSEWMVQTEHFREKAKTTLRQNYGVENPSQSETIQKRKKETFQKNFGVEHYSQNVDVKKRTMQAHLDRYGCHFFQTSEFKEVAKQTMMQKYGVDNIFKSDQFMQAVTRDAVARFGQKGRGMVSNAETEWLNDVGINEESRQKSVIGASGKRYFVDGLLQDVVFEFLGVFWHGHPSRYNSTDFNRVVGVTFGELYERTVRRIQDIEAAGYTVYAFWETGELFTGRENDVD